jgi:hypothetical protein
MVPATIASARGPAPPPCFAERDALTDAIQNVVRDGVIDVGEEYSGARGGTYNGFCFRACEAYWRLVRDLDYATMARDPKVKLRYYPRSKPGEGKQRGRTKSHYWLVNSSNEIIDLTLGSGEESDYSHFLDAGVGGRGIANPSRDATKIIEAVKAAHRPRRLLDD